MTKVTRIVYSKNLNQGKYEQLVEIAHRCGAIRKEVWQRYSSLAGVGITHWDVRNEWMAQERDFGLPARVWKQTLADVMDDISAYREAAKLEVRRAIFNRYPDKKDEEQEQECIRLFTLLKYDRWTEDDYLRRKMRKYFKHGHTDVDNQIVLDCQCYTAFERNGKGWIKVTSLTPRKRIAIPLNSAHPPTGTIRLVLRDSIVEVHYIVDEQIACAIRPCGEADAGIDKGYTEVFTDQDNDRYGQGLGKVLTKESDYLNEKYKRRNKLKAVAKKNPAKAERIRANNLGRKKLNRRKKKHTRRVRDIVYKATHGVVDKAKTIASENLTSPIKNRDYGKGQNRRLASWVKGTMAEALESVTRRRGSTLILVNCAYTSQTDSRYDILLGERNGDWFYCFDGVVLPADQNQNAARTILRRKGDKEITLYTPYKEVKRILEARTQERLGLINQDSSCSGSSLVGDIPIVVPLSTESELPSFNQL